MRSEKNGGALLSACWDIFISGNRASIGCGTFPLDDSADKRRGEARGVWRVLTFGQHKTRRLFFDWTKCQWSDFLHLQTCNCQQKVSKRSLVFVTWLGLLFPLKEMLCTPKKGGRPFLWGTPVRQVVDTRPALQILAWCTRGFYRAGAIFFFAFFTIFSFVQWKMWLSKQRTWR